MDFDSRRSFLQDVHQNKMTVKQRSEIHRVKTTAVYRIDVYNMGRIRLGGFVEHFKIVKHISYSTGTSRNFVEHKRYQ